jgi:hypothetical protein
LATPFVFIVVDSSLKTSTINKPLPKDVTVLFGLCVLGVRGQMAQAKAHRGLTKRSVKE